jgi:hypothetical protein
MTISRYFSLLPGHNRYLRKSVYLLWASSHLPVHFSGEQFTYFGHYKGTVYAQASFEEVSNSGMFRRMWMIVTPMKCLA